MTKENNNPWAGLASYEDPAKSERKLKFCGRDNDIYDVTRMIDDNLLLILYGKSGIGKTSLLNAGVFPELRKEQYLPVSIRLGTLEPDSSYQKAIISAIENAIKEIQDSITVFNVVEEQTDNQLSDRLWNYFARHRFADAKGQPVFPVVVLDQFEEVLRNSSPEHVGKAQVLLNQLQYLVDESHALNDCVVDGKEYYYDFNFRFVISIREDELYLLEDSIDDLSLSMFRNCRYRLRSLSEQGATEAILVPGKGCIAEEQKQAVVDRIIALSKRPQNNDIDTLLLSLVCSGTFDKKAGEKITLSDLAVWKSNPMEVYYQDAVKGLSTTQIRYIQQHLIREDGSRRRVNAEEVKTALGEATYRQLSQDTNCLFAIGDNGQVELLHDQLGLAVYEDRKIAEEKERKRKHRQKHIRNIGILTLIVVLGVFITQNLRYKQIRWKMLENQSRFIAEKAKAIVLEKPNLATLLALEVLPKNVDNPERPYTEDAESLFNSALEGNVSFVSLKGHLDEVNSAFFSPNGKLIVSASNDSTVRVWDVETNNEIMVLKGHNGPVQHACFCMDGTKILSASSDKTMRIWDAETGNLIRSIEGHLNEVYYACFSPDERSIASSAYNDYIKIWDVETGNEICTLEDSKHSRCTPISFSPDGNRILSSNYCSITIWDAITGKKVSTIEDNSEIRTAFFNPKGSMIVYTTGRVIKILDVETGKCIKILEGHNKTVDFATFSSDAKYVFSCSYDNTIRKWGVDNENCLKIYDRYKIKSRYLTSPLSIDPSGSHIAIVGNNNAVEIININDTLFRISHFESIDPFFISATYNSDGKIFVLLSTYSDSTSMLYVWDGVEQPSIRYKIDDAFMYMASISSDGNRILSIVDNTVIKYNTQTGEKDTLIGHIDRVNSVNYSPNGELIVSASNDNTVRIWDSKTGQCLHILKEYGDVWCAKFTPDGNHVIASSNNFCLWDIDKETVVPLILPNENIGAAESIDFSVDGKYMVSCHQGICKDWICLWDTKKWSCYRVIEDLDGGEWVNEDPKGGTWTAPSIISTSPNSLYFASTVGDGTIKIWNIKTGKRIRSIFESHYSFTSLSFSPSGNSILATTPTDAFIYYFKPLQELINQTRERFKDIPLTPEERRMYYLEE